MFQDAYENLSETEKVVLEQFMIFFSSCPICKNRNHEVNLKRFYFSKNPENKQLKEILLNFLSNGSFHASMGIQIGIPCCNCFKKLFE